MKRDDLYTHKDGEVYKVLDIDFQEKTLETFRSKDNMRVAWVTFKPTLIWYCKADDASTFYVRTKEHFLESFAQLKTKGT